MKTIPLLFFNKQNEISFPPTFLFGAENECFSSTLISISILASFFINSTIAARNNNELRTMKVNFWIIGGTIQTQELVVSNPTNGRSDDFVLLSLSPSA
jgi:hypothetical protein